MLGEDFCTAEGSAVNARRSDDGGLEIRFAVTNTGSVAGDEVPQIYLGKPKSALPEGVQSVPQSLAGFTRVHLLPGRSATGAPGFVFRLFERGMTPTMVPDPAGAGLTEMSSARTRRS